MLSGLTSRGNFARFTVSNKMYHKVIVEQAASEPTDLHLLLGTFLCALANLSKVTSSVVMSVRPSACDNSASTIWIFMKFDIEYF